MPQPLKHKQVTTIENSLKQAVAVLILALVSGCSVKTSQPDPILDSDLILEKASALITENYFRPGQLREIEAALRQWHSTQTTPTITAENTRSLNRVFQSFDRHFGMYVIDRCRVQFGLRPEPHRTGARENTPIVFAEKLESTIGYFRLNSFSNRRIKFGEIISELEKLSSVEHLIIDLRFNHGGTPRNAVDFLGLFSPHPSVPTYVVRSKDHTYSIAGVNHLQNDRLLKAKLIILTSETTASAAEAVAYHMKQTGRATLIGATTIGAANLATTYSVNECLNIQIPTSATVHLASNTNWEGKGVEPDHAVNPDKALEHALDLIASGAL